MIFFKHLALNMHSFEARHPQKVNNSNTPSWRILSSVSRVKMSVDFDLDSTEIGRKDRLLFFSCHHFQLISTVL